MKKLILILFIPLISFCQDDTKKNGLQKLLKQAEKIYKEIENKGTSDIDFSNTDIGNTNFDIADRIAIEDVIDAYGFYWDSNNLEGYLSLFLDDAIGVTIDSQGDKDKYYIKSDSQIENSQKRMDYFIKNQMQRRHIMANTFFIELTNNYAHLKKYMILLTTNNKSKTEILTPINYVFKLKKVNGFWKIVYREINLDKPLDLALTKKSN